MKLDITDVCVECNTILECTKVSLIFQSYGYKWASGELHPKFNNKDSFIGLVMNNLTETNIAYRLYEDNRFNIHLNQTLISFETFIETY